MLRARLMTETDEVAARQVLRLLREQPEGLRSLILLLQHGDREIIRRAAAVLGMLGVREAVPALTRVARHDDLTVRAAAIAALARLATPQAVELLGELLDEAGLDGMGVVVDALGGAALGPLVPRIENLGRRVRDARALATLAHALGRIGTRQAVGVLADWAAPPGWRFWRRRGAVRLAAVDGLRIAAAPEAVRILEGLSRDADPAVRRAALEAVEDLSIAAPARGP
jgi:HEAT repeat protein